jgi:hypothetical protein
MPGNAGIQRIRQQGDWMPDFAGMTEKDLPPNF